MAALTIIPDTITTRFTDRIIAKTFLTSSYERISKNVEPLLVKRLLILLLLVFVTLSTIVNSYEISVDINTSIFVKYVLSKCRRAPVKPKTLTDACG